MREGIRLFNEQKYWECHEALEDVWMEDRNDPVRNVYWAVIQVAAACIHHREGNDVGKKGMIFKAKEKFRRCREQHLLSDLAFKYLDWDEFEALAMKEDFIGIYDFRFKNFPAEGESL
jgi:predicted metal-dependent hydrolase